jgi:hypothetical protein
VIAKLASGRTSKATGRAGDRAHHAPQVMLCLFWELLAQLTAEKVAISLDAVRDCYADTVAPSFLPNWRLVSGVEPCAAELYAPPRSREFAIPRPSANAIPGFEHSDAPTTFGQISCRDEP